MAARITGIFAPNLVPLDEQGRINEPELRRFIDWLIERGVHGLFVNGSTGEFTRFTEEERRNIVQIACEQAKGRVPIIAGASEAHLGQTLRACETYLGFGARAVAIVPGYYFRLSQGAIEAYFREIARQSPIDVFLYNIPAFANPMELETILRLAELPRIIGIKESSGDMGLMLRLLAAVRRDRPEFSVMTGSEAVLAPMLLMGVDGGTHSIANVVPEAMRHLYDLMLAGRVNEAQALQQRVLELLDALLALEFPSGFRRGAQMRGFNMGAGRQPLPATSATSATSAPDSFDAKRVEALIGDLHKDLERAIHPELLSEARSCGR